MSKTSTEKPPRSAVKNMVRKAIETVTAIKEALSQPEKKDQYVNRRPVFRPRAVTKTVPKIELLRFRKPNQRKRRKLNRQINSRGFKFRYA